jgi:hypothetical protein
LFPIYVFGKTLASRCRQAGLGGDPIRLFESLAEIAPVDDELPTRPGGDSKPPSAKAASANPPDVGGFRSIDSG